MPAVAEIAQEGRRRTAAAPTSPLDIVHAALKSGNVEMYREAVALMKEMAARAAEKAFINALADAKAELPIIKKIRAVEGNAATGQKAYRHEELAQVVEIVVPILGRFGLSHRWRLRGKPGEPVSVTCILSHREGHSEENEISADADTTGGKNAIQGVKSAVSYLERITLMASLGIAAGEDDDGRATSGTAEPEVYTPPAGAINQQQASFLREALEEKGASLTAFLQWAEVKRIEDVPATRYAACVNVIANYRKV